MTEKNKNRLVRYHSVQYNNLNTTEKYLEQMAAKGWMLEEISGGVKFVFKKSEPAKLKFSANIFSEGSEYDTHLLESNLEYIDYCESAGWRFVCAAGTVHVFYTENEDTPVIDSDPMIKLKAIHTLMWPQKLLVGSIMSVIAIMQIVYSLTLGLNVTEQSVLSFSNLILWSFVLVLWVIQGTGYLIWYSKAKHAAQSGEKLPEGKKTDFKVSIIALVVFAVIHSGILCWAGIMFHDFLSFIAIPIWMIVFLFMVACYKIRQISEKNKLGATGWKLISFVIAPAILVVLLSGVTIGIAIYAGSEEQNCNIITDTSVFEDDGVEFVDYEQDYVQYGTFLINSYRYSLTGIRGDKTEKSWDFYVLETKIPAIHERLLREAKDDSVFRTMGVAFRLGEAEEFREFDTGNVDVYVNQIDDEYAYLLYDEDSIVTLRTESVLTKEQFDVINHALRR